MSEGFRRRKRHTHHNCALLLAYWRSYTFEHGQPPTIRLAMAEFGFASTSTVDYHLRKLVDAGKLRHVPRAPFAYRLPLGDHAEAADA